MAGLIRNVVIALGVFASIVFALPGRSAPGQGALITVIEENDDFVLDGDKHYTQGLKLSYLYSEEKTPDWSYNLAQTLPSLGMGVEVPRFGYALGQNIYTPKNVRSTQPITDDRPYAGWLYFGVVLERRGKQGSIPVNDTLELDLGFIGPGSLAQQAQAQWHTIGGWFIPRGWDHQLKTEPAIDIKYDRQWKFGTTSQGVGLEFIPHAGVRLGNVMTYGAAGAMVRFGYHIPHDFGVQTIDSLSNQTGDRSFARRHAFGWYVFAAADGRAVLRNAFLDGNLYQTSPHVDKEPLVADFKAGLVMAFRRFDIGASFVHRTREYKGQPRCDQFGSISLNAKF